METRANFVLVGAFTVAVIAGAFMFVLWFSGLGQVSQRKVYEVLFSGSVSGLSRGASVLFNGLRVGEVTQIDFVPHDPGRVAAFIHVESRIPINKDTTARLELQGLTGGSAVALTGGAPDAAPLVGENGAPPVIVAEPSQIQNLLENVQNISSKADAVLGKADKLLSDNSATITDTLRNVDTFSKALGDSSAGVGGAVTGIGELGRKIGPLAERLETLTDHADKLIGAVNPDKVRQAVDDVATFTGALADGKGSIKNVLDDTAALAKHLNDSANRLDAALADYDALAKSIDAKKVGAIVDSAEAITETLSQNKANIGRLLENAADLSVKLQGSTDRLDSALSDIDTVVKAVDAKKVASLVDGGEALGQALSQNKGNIDNLIKDSSALAGRLNGTTVRLDSALSDFDGLVKAVDAKKVADVVDAAKDIAGQLKESSGRLNGALSDVDTVVKAVDPKKVASLVDGADALGQALSQNKGNIDNLIKDSSALAAKLNGSSERLDSALSDFDSLVKSVDAKKVAGIVDGVQDLTGKLNATSGRLDGALSDVDALVKSVDPKKVASLVDGADALGQALSQNRGNIDNLIKDSLALASKLNGSTERLDAALSDFDSLVKSVDTKKVSDIVSGVQDLTGKLNATSGRLDGALSDVDTLVKSVDPKKVGNLVDGADALGQALTQNKGAIDSLLKDSAQLASELKESRGRLDSALSDVDTLVKSVDTKKVANIVDGADALAETLTQNRTNVDRLLRDSADLAGALKESTGRLDGALSDFDALVKSVDTKKVGNLVDGADALGQTLSQNKANIDKLIKDSADLAGRLKESTGRLDTALSDVDTLVKSVDTKKVANIVDGADALGVTLSQNKGNIDKLLKDSADLAGQLKQSAGRLDRALSDVDGIVKSVDANKVATIVDGASALGATLTQNKGNIDRLLKDSADLAGQLKVSSGHLDGALTDFDGLVKSVDTKKVATLVDGADALGEALRQNKGNIDRMLKDSAELAAKLDASADKVDGLITSLQGFVGSPDLKGPLAEVSDAARSIRQLADDLNVRTKEISVGLTKFTGAGLREYEALAIDGRRTVNDLDRVLRGLERNPSQLIFGAKPNLPEYHGSP